jgi:formate dehydrogenase major subunit
VEACNNTVTNEVLGFMHRSNHTAISFDDDKLMGESSCVQCGECAQICPVGALTDKLSMGQARYWEVEKVQSVCPYCGVGCKLEIHVDRASNKIVRINGVEGAPTNDGMLCVKGRYGYDFVGHPDRLKTPLIKENGVFREASWDEATTLVAQRLGEIKQKHGADKIMGLASAKVTNEENFVFQKFFRTALGTNNLDHCARL